MAVNPVIEILREQFESDIVDSTSIDDSRDITIYGIKTNALEIIEGDPEMLREIEIEWVSDIKLTASEYIESISGILQNRNRIKDLLQAVLENQVTPFIGSGMSSESGFPTWKEFLKDLQKLSDVPDERFEDLVASGEYDLLASEISASLDDSATEELMRNTFRIRNEEIKNRLNGAIRFLPMIKDNIVVTTNYDNVIEIVYEKFGIHFEKALGSRIDDYAHLSRGDTSILLKLHGDLYLPGSRVLTKSEYDAVYAPDGTYVKTLKDIYRSNQFLFLGCSLDSDKTLEVFSSCIPLYKDHYAFLRVKLDDGNVKSAEESIKLHEARLRKMGIKVIWYTGEPARALQNLMISMLAAKGVI